MQVREVEIFDCRSGPGESGWNPVIIRVNTDEGVSGLGEVALAYGVGSSAAVGMARTLAERFLIGADPFRIEHLWDRMYGGTFWGQGGQRARQRHTHRSARQSRCAGPTAPYFVVRTFTSSAERCSSHCSTVSEAGLSAVSPAGCSSPNRSIFPSPSGW